MGKVKTKADAKPRKPARRRSLYEDLKEGLDEVRRYFQGEKTGIRVVTVKRSPLRVAVLELKDAREKAGLSVEQVAKATGIPAARLQRIETAKVKTPSIDELERYAGAVGLKLRLSLEPVK